MLVDVKLRVDDGLYRFFVENNVDIGRVMQLFLNQMNYYFRESMSVYDLIDEVRVEEVLRRMALEHEEACRRRDEKRREYQEKERRETIEGESS